MAGRRHITGFGIVMAWLSLVLLTALSWAASVVEVGALESAVAIGIATIKGLVVVFVFMHLLESRFVTRFVVLISALFVLLLVVGVIADVAERRELPGFGGEGVTDVPAAPEGGTPASGQLVPAP